MLNQKAFYLIKGWDLGIYNLRQAKYYWVSRAVFTIIKNLLSKALKTISKTVY